MKRVVIDHFGGPRGPEGSLGQRLQVVAATIAALLVILLLHLALYPWPSSP